MAVNNQNQLLINGVNTLDLVEKYNTPLNVFDIDLIKENLNVFKNAFEKENQPYQVAYASKAFSSLSLYQILAKEKVSLDVVSGGELFLAIQSGFPVERIHFHGNNKSEGELREAIDHNIGCIVIDNFFEISLIEKILQETKKEINVLIRLTPGISAHTHEYISTGQTDSKFGFDLASGQAEEAIRTIQNVEGIKLIGIHAHIGSQIFETDAFDQLVEKLMTTAKDWKLKYDFDLEVLNVGGGFGIEYTEADRPKPKKDFIHTICQAVRQQTEKLSIPKPQVWIEPGRSIVGEAGTSLYTIGSDKHLPEVRHYFSVDGGMADNIRPALYQAEYTGVLANRVNDDKVKQVSIAGKACESGDMLIYDIKLPSPKAGDILAMLSTGAYGYAMASNYNRLPRPAVVFIENGKEYLAIRRETYHDFLNLEQSIYSEKNPE